MASCARFPGAAEPRAAAPLVAYACESGEVTLDRSDGGGNPFASALVELLARPSLTGAEFPSQLTALTEKKSRGLQTPELVATGNFPVSWALKPVPAAEIRVAWVFVYSDYRKAGGPRLPGAERDLRRVTAALSAAGFRVETVLNPTREELRAAMEELSRRSRDADVAALYLTGHGVEHDGRVYLLPGDYSPDDDPERFPEFALPVASLAEFLKARRANLVFYGGCRTYW